MSWLYYWPIHGRQHEAATLIVEHRHHKGPRVVGQNYQHRPMLLLVSVAMAVTAENFYLDSVGGEQQ